MTVLPAESSASLAVDDGAAREPAEVRRPDIDRLAASLRPLLPAADLEARALCPVFARLLGRHLRFDAADPLWPDRDRLVLSAGTAGLGALAASLMEAGPGLFHAPGQWLGAAVGLALAERALAARFGRSLVDHRSWALGAGSELASGAAQEAAGLAGAARLGRLTAIVLVETAEAPGVASFAAHGWAVRRARLAHEDEVAAALSAALRSVKPTLIVCLSSGQPCVGADRVDAADCWAAVSMRGAGVRRSWLRRLSRHAGRQEFERAVAGRLPAGWSSALAEPAWLASAASQPVSTAQAVRRALADVTPLLPMLVGQTGNGVAQAGAGQPESASCAALSGLALHGGVLPVAAQELEGSERAMPALLDATRAGTRLLQILVEPSVRHPSGGRRAGLRAMRNLAVFRPADVSEALECLELALRRATGPSVLLLSEWPAPPLAERPSRTRSARGGYVVFEPSGRRDATLVASGPELHTALAARGLLAARGVVAGVVSLPCWTLFDAQGAEWRAAVLGDVPRIGVEAGSGFGWERWLGRSGLFVDLSPGAGDTSQRRLEDDAQTVCDAVLRHLAGHACQPER